MHFRDASIELDSNIYTVPKKIKPVPPEMLGANCSYPLKPALALWW